MRLAFIGNLKIGVLREAGMNVSLPYVTNGISVMAWRSRNRN